MDSNKIKKVKMSEPKCSYIIVNGIKIYITVDIKKNTTSPYGLLFSIPTLINNKLFDFHYHFGKRQYEYTVITDKQYINNIANKSSRTRKTNRLRKTRKNIKMIMNTINSMEIIEPIADIIPINQEEKIIYFHKTIQHTTNGEDGFREHKNCYFQDNTDIKSINNIICLDKDETVMGRLFSDFDKTILNEIIKRPFDISAKGKKSRKKSRKKFQTIV